MNWICSEGGPLILMPVECLNYWKGVEPKTVGESDYDRACEVDEYIGTLDVGGYQVVVFGDEPMQTCWIPHTNCGFGIFVRWRFAENEDEVVRHLGSLAKRDFVSHEVVVHATTTDYVLFDSALRGGNLACDESINVELGTGQYLVRTALYRPDAKTSLIIHGFELVM